jgi:hypothetical protein
MISIEEIKLLIEKFEKLKGSDFEKLIQNNLQDLKNLKQMIERKDKESGHYVSKGASWYRDDLAEKKDFKPSNLLYRDIKDKIWHFAKTNMYNSLEIGPGHTQFSDLFLTWKKQFFLDVLPELEKKVRAKFNPQHQKYIKFYTTDGHHCGDVPTNSVNFVFSWDTFVFFTTDQIDQYLASIHNVSIPGGYVMLQYADCHFDFDLAQSKKGYWAYNNKSIMTSLIEKNNFAVIEMGQFTPGQNYAIFKKPGKQNPIVYRVSELELD